MPHMAAEWGNIMSQASLGSFNGTTVAGENMLSVFRELELQHNPNCILNFTNMTLRKLSMACPAGTKVSINGREIVLVTGIFELGYDQVDISSLVFSEAVELNAYYLY